MIKIIRFSLVFILFNFCYTLKAQDHLEPVGSIYDVYDYQFEYYSKVRKVLYKGLSDAPEIRFQVMASFKPENVLVIEFDNEKNKYYLIHHVCKEMIWYHKEWKSIKVDKYKKEIDKASVDLIKSLFQKAVYQSKFPKEEMLGNDGTNYYFSVRNYGMKSGTIWSPAKESKTGKLVAIGNKMIVLAKSDQSIIKFDKELLKEIKELITRLK